MQGYHAEAGARVAVVLFILMVGLGANVQAATRLRGPLTATELSTEYRTKPLGVDAASPHLGWVLQAAGRGQQQTAYQVLVASSTRLLAAHHGDLWDSGQVRSSQSFGVPFAGAVLHSDQRCYWKVRVWDRAGAVSPWSAASYWQMGLRRPGDWSARWISPGGPADTGWRDYDVDVDFRILRQQIGVVFRARDSENLYMWQFSVAGGKPRLRRHLCLDGNWQVREADLPAQSLAAVDQGGGQFGTGWHHLKVELRQNEVRSFIDESLVDTTAWSIFPQVLPSGTVGFRSGDAAEAGAFKHLRVQDASGKSLLTDDFTGDNHFTGGSVDAANRQLVLVNGQLALQRSGAEASWRSPLLHKAFIVAKPIQRATAYVFGLGWYELHINGVKADDRVLAPANTQYQRRRLYDTYDLTRLMKTGGNAIGLWLGDGYRTGKYSKWGWSWDGLPGALLQLNIVYADGSTARIVTDESWSCSQSAITANHIYDGETYDARREQAAWDQYGPLAGTAGHDNAWQPVQAASVDYSKLAPNPAPPLRVTQVLRPVALLQPAVGRFVFDMGQNFAGWARLRVRGPAGTQVVLHYSENIDAATKNIDPWTNRNARATDTYILKGDGVETYQPRFTYHGFRYVEVQGYPGTPTLDNLSGCVVHTAAATVGQFRCSDPLLNQIQSNICWGIGSNLMSIPTDCPQRDERTPCQMDSAAYEEAAIHNFDLHTYYLKWLADIRGDTGQPDWSGDQVTLCWHLYQLYGDREILAQSYDGLKKYIDSHQRQVSDPSDTNYLFKSGFGDWCAPNADGSYEHSFSSVRETNTALYYRHLLVFADIARLLGKTADAAQYTALAATVKTAFNREFWQAAPGHYGDGRQTTALLPLAFGLVLDDQKPRLVQNLLHNIEVEQQGHLDTGIYGTRYFLDVLADLGKVDTAYAALRQPTYPGFGFQIAHGATTLWEQWIVKGGMESHNHAMFAGIGASFYTRLGGITPAAPGYTAIDIKPQVPRGLTFVETSLHTPMGTVVSNWRVEVTPGPTRRFHLTITIPANTTAEVHLPTHDTPAITESGQALARAKDVRIVGFQDNRVVLAVGSGTYDFLVSPAALS